MNEERNWFPDLLRRLIKRSGQPLKELSRSTRIHYTQLSRFQTADRVPRPDQFKALARALALHGDELAEFMASAERYGQETQRTGQRNGFGPATIRQNLELASGMDDSDEVAAGTSSVGSLTLHAAWQPTHAEFIAYLTALRDAAERRGTPPYLGQLSLQELSQVARLAPANQKRPSDALAMPPFADRYWEEELERDPNHMTDGRRPGHGERWHSLRSRIRRAVVIADAGLGKTTLLLGEAQLTAIDALEQLGSELEPPVGDIEFPVYARLDDIADRLALGRDLFDAIADVAIAAQGAVLNYVLREASVALLLDGLDELPSGGREGIRSPRDLVEESLNWLVEGDDVRRFRIVVASRMQGYRAPWRLRPSSEEDELELLPLAPDRVATTMERWLRDDAVLAGASSRYLTDNPTLRSLGQNPLFLTFMYVLIRSAGASQLDRLPQSRAELYEGMVTELVRGQWRERERERLDRPGAIEETLRRVEAAALTLATADRGWLATFGADRLYVALGADAAASFDDLVLRAGVFTQLNKANWGEVVPYSFIHRSVHEYLVARALSHRGMDEALQLVSEHLWFDPEWEHVLIFLAARAAAPSRLIRRLLDEPHDALHQMTFLAARCSAEVAENLLDEQMTKEVGARCAHALLSRSLLDRRRAASAGGSLPTVLMARVALHFASDRSEATEGMFELLERLRFPGALPELLGGSRSKDTSVRIAAAMGLRGQTDDGARDRLIEMLQDPEPPVAREAAVALESHGSQRTFLELLKLMRDAGRKRVAAVLKPTKRSRFDWAVPLAAASTAGAIAGDQVDQLIAMAGSPDASTQELAVVALAASPGDIATRALVGCLSLEGPQVRALAMGALRSREVEGELRESIQQTVRTMVAGLHGTARLDALGLLAISSDEVPEELLRDLSVSCDAPGSVVVEGLAQAIARVASESALMRLSESSSTWVRTMVGGLLGGRGEIAAQRLSTILASPNEEYWCTRVAAAKAMAAIRWAASRPTLELALRADPERNVREACAEALGMLRHMASVPALVDALADGSEDLRVRASAGSALGLIGGETAVDALRRHGDADLNVRDTGAEVLAARLQRGDIDAFEQLIRYSASADPLASIQAYAALSRTVPALARRTDWLQLREMLANVTSEFVYSEQWMHRVVAAEEARSRDVDNEPVDSSPKRRGDGAEALGRVADDPPGVRRYFTGRTTDDWDAVMTRIEARKETAIVRSLQWRNWEVWREGRLSGSFPTEIEALNAVGVAGRS